MSQVAILCVDDHPALLATLRVAIHDAIGPDCIVGTETQAQQALHTLQSWLAAGYDVPLVLVDYRVPHVNEAHLLRRIHALTPDTRKILMTAYDSYVNLDQLADDVRLYRILPKPWSHTDLRVTLREAVHSYFQEKRLHSYVGLLDASHAQEQVQQSQRLYRTLIRNLPDMSVLLFDRDLHYLVAEGPYLYEIGYEHLEGRTLYDAMPAHVIKELEPFYHAALRGEVSNYVHESEQLCYHASFLPIYNDAGAIIAGMVVARDISAQRRAENALRSAKNAAEAANRAKSTFLANMSHELRTPLNAILGFAQLSAQDTHLSASTRSNIDMIMRSGEHLLQLINDVLDMSRIEAGRIELRYTDFDVHRLLKELYDMFEMVADNKNLRLTLHQAPHIPQYLHSDVGKLRQVLINLLSNAIKFTDTGRIELHADYQPDPQTLIVRVQDSGRGILPADLPTLFDAFTQTETARDIGQGTGLGLSISKAYVDLLGGRIEVSSEVGVGSSFSVTLPVTLGDAVPLVASTSQQSTLRLAPGSPSFRILVVDDNEESRHVLQGVLSSAFEVRTVDNGKSALMLIPHLQPDLIFMDMRMADMNGLEVTRRVRALRGIVQPVIIAFTANVLGYERADMLTAGCDDVLSKPAKFQDVYEMLRRHLGVQFQGDGPPNGHAARITADGPIPLLGAAAWLQIKSDERAALRHAALIGDLNALREFVAYHNAQHPQLAAFVAQCLERFEFEHIVIALEAL